MILEKIIIFKCSEQDKKDVKFVAEFFGMSISALLRSIIRTEMEFIKDQEKPDFKM